MFYFFSTGLRSLQLSLKTILEAHPSLFVFGLKVTVKEAATNAIVTEGLTLTARDGSYEEQLIRAESSDFFIGAGEREGTYVIKITSNDYQTYSHY